MERVLTCAMGGLVAALVGSVAFAQAPFPAVASSVSQGQVYASAVSKYEVVIRVCGCIPFNASESSAVRDLVSKAPIPVPPIGSFVYSNIDGQNQSAFIVWRLTTDFYETANGSLTYRTIVETAPQEALAQADPQLPALGLTGLSIAGAPPRF